MPRKKQSETISDKRWYRLYWGMRNRCESPNCSNYKHYGGRGISVCEEWHDPKVFYKWAIENGYTDELTIERIDVNGNYCPENCKWISRKEQAFNKTDSRRTTINNETKTVSQWEAEGVKFENVPVRMKKELRDRLKEVAEERGMTLHNLMVSILKEYVGREKEDGKR